MSATIPPRATSHCQICGRQLTNSVSVALHIGPVCRGGYQAINLYNPENPQMDAFKTRASWTYEHIEDHNIIAITDQFDPLHPSMSVTNDAEAVIEALAHMEDLSNTRVIYCDTDGRWDELRVEDGHRFVGYRPIGVHQLADALKKVAT